MIDVCITNLGKYNEGELCGEYLKLPATKEDVKALLSRIGVDGVLYEEIIITDYESDVGGLEKLLCEYESIDELNYLAAMLSKLDDRDLAKFEAALEHAKYTLSVEAMINLAQNLDCYEYYPDVMDYEDLGYYHAEQIETLSIPEHLEYYIDFESYGRDIAINEGGVLTEIGYVHRNEEDFTEYYKGCHIPDEYRIFAFPDPPDRMPIKQQLEMYGRMALAYTAADRKAPALEAR